MKKIVKAFSGLILVAALFVAGSALVITYPDEYTIVRQFGEIVRVVSACKRTEEYRGMALDGDPEEWDAAHGSLGPAVEARLEEVAEHDLEFERG